MPFLFFRDISHESFAGHAHDLGDFRVVYRHSLAVGVAFSCGALIGRSASCSILTRLNSMIPLSPNFFLFLFVDYVD